LIREEGERLHKEGGQETRLETPDPPAKEAGTPRPQEPEETVLALGAISPSRHVDQGVRASPGRPRRVGPRWHLAWCLLKGPTGRAQPDPRLPQGREEGAWLGARVP